MQAHHDDDSTCRVVGGRTSGLWGHQQRCPTVARIHVQADDAPPVLGMPLTSWVMVTQ